MMREIIHAMQAYGNDVARAFTHFLPRFLAAVLMLLVGLFIAQLARILTRRILKLLRFNELMQRTGAADFLSRVQLSAPDRILGSLVFWSVWIGLFLTALRTLGVEAVDTLAADFVRYLPKLASAMAIVIVGIFLSNFAWRATLLAAVNARVPIAKLLALGVRGLTIIAAVAMALEQLAIGQNVILTAFAISFGAVMLAAAIAFGLGGRDLARQYLEEHLRMRSRAEERERQSEPRHM